MRTKGATEQSIRAAYDRGEFLRTHILRPTWHYVLPADIRWILELTAPNILRLNQGQARELELGPTVYRRTHALISKALEGGVHLTREELSGVLRRGKIEATGRRLAYVMMEAELTGLVCSGAMKGKQHTYALLAERAPRGRKVGREEGVAELLRRFITGHAPVTLKQFSWWSGISLKESKSALEELRKEFEVELIDGVEWFCAQRKGRGGSGPRAWFIPEYDELLAGTADIGIPRLMADRRIPGRTTNTFDRPIIIDGRWVGTWKRKFEGKGAVLEAALFGKITVGERDALEKETTRYGKYLGVPVRLTSELRRGKEDA
jgi:hypothetical protein